jgi:hypothetical protein
MLRTDVLVIATSLLTIGLTFVRSLDIYLIFLTHCFAIPSYFVVKGNRWLVCFLSFSVFASLLWHISKEDFYNKQFEQFDIVHQNLLVAISVCVVLYKSIPQMILSVLFFYTIVLSIFGMNTIDNVPLYEIMTGAWLVPLFIHGFYIEEKREYFFILCAYSVVAIVTFILADTSTYNMLHSIWHVCAYCSLYFSFKLADWERSDFARENFQKLEQT